MGNYTTALTFVLFINLLMMITNVTIYNIATEENVDINSRPNFYNCQGGGNNLFMDCAQSQIVNNSNIPGLFPGSAETTSPTTGNIFTDVFTSIKNWMLQTPGLNYVYVVVSSPASIIGALNLPSPIGELLGGFWYALTIFLIIAFLWWRD